MRILEVNSVPYGSTARIMQNISNKAIENGHIAMMACGFSRHILPSMINQYFKIDGIIDKFLHMELSKISGNELSFSYFCTLRFINYIDQYQPDIIHLHNLHGWYINIPLFIKYINIKNIPVIWTLHDCWSFTGHCPHFIYEKCHKWERGCSECPKYKLYPSSIFDNSNVMWLKKKELFTSIENLTIVTPSEWLASNVKNSYLSQAKLIVINNGIDLSIFKYHSEYQNKENSEKIYLLGVADTWTSQKGYDDFVKLSYDLNDNFEIILIGNIPSNAIHSEHIRYVNHTQNQEELVKYYSLADVFINPTREDNFPTVNMEAIACGTPVITYNTGGCGEIINLDNGFIINTGDYCGLCECIKSKKYLDLSKKQILESSKQYDKNDCYMKYIRLMEEEL